MWKPTGGGIRTRKAAARAGPANWTPAESFNRLAGSMKRKSGDWTVTVEEFHPTSVSPLQGKNHIY